MNHNSNYKYCILQYMMFTFFHQKSSNPTYKKTLVPRESHLHGGHPTHTGLFLGVDPGNDIPGTPYHPHKNVR